MGETQSVRTDRTEDFITALGFDASLSSLSQTAGVSGTEATDLTDLGETTRARYATIVIDASTINQTKDSTSLAWRNPSSSKVVVTWNQNAFAHGAVRSAHIGFRTVHSDKPGEKVVVKRFLSTVCWAASDWDRDLKTLKKTQEYVDEWNQMALTTKEVEVMPMDVIEVSRKSDDFPMHSYVVVEPFIVGDYEKFNSNSGWCDHTKLSIHALCHWTYEKWWARDTLRCSRRSNW